ncbi:MAG: hypothetical protein A3G81_29100 [Betaproteobacteria bacterium RIFCSPLOWO2_12_FULL_65_14]|nr:MAG: hypothetical protein A3G81_29100 [Betaproteobacteria bacterium RIFCSPLOWO2_12_FULL_65_14]
MRRTRHLAFIVTVWAATVAPGFAQPRDLTGVGTDYVALVYDDSSIPDGDRAALVTFVAAAVPVEKWPVVTVTASTHIHCLIDDFYDYYPNGAFQTPRTVDALQTAIVRYNEALGQRTTVPPMLLRIPPFPVHAYHSGRRQTKRRIYDAEVRGYSITVQGPDERPSLPAEAGILGRTKCSSTSSAMTPLPSDAADIAATTLIVPAMPTEIVRLPEQLGVPRQVLIFNTTIDAGSGIRKFKTGFSTVELLHGGQTCTDGSDWLNASPYFQYWNAKKLGGRFDTPEVVKRALAQPLRVLDVGFDGGHGSQVMAVAQQLLAQLGLARLAAVGSEALKPWELVPSSTASAAEALAMLEQYGLEYRAAAQVFDAHQAEAKAWLNEREAVRDTFDVPDLVLGALMWRSFRQNLWVNVSSRFRAPFLSDVVSSVVESSGGVLFAAVGNKPRQLTRGWVPQDHSFSFPQVISVTCGRSAGEICGEHGDSTNGGSTAPRVLIAGPGCGFSGTSNVGSSLATPYVAVASWLAQLLADGGAPPGTPRDRAVVRRHDLVTANMPSATLSHPVESHGLFDPAYLLLKPPPHVIKADNSLSLIKSYRIGFRCEGRDDLAFGPPMSTANSQARNYSDTIMVYEKDGKPHLWRREVLVDSSSVSQCPLEALDVKLTHPDGVEETFDLSSFPSEVRWITWTPYQWPDVPQ